MANVTAAAAKTAAVQVKVYRTGSRMLRGQQVQTASYKLDFEGGKRKCKVLRACDPPCELAFPDGMPSSKMAVEAVRAICRQEVAEGSIPALLARAMVVPNAPFQKLVAVSNLKKLLKLQIPKDSFKNVIEAGSTLYRLDVDGSDHDIEVVFKGESADHTIAQMLTAAMQSARADAEERVVACKTRSKDYHALAEARLEPFEYGVRIHDFPAGTEWDVVATKQAKDGYRYQYDASTERWKPMLSSYVRPMLEDWWVSKRELFFSAKLLKMWNARLPPLRRKWCPAAGCWRQATPLSSFHIVLLAIAAAKDWNAKLTLQDAFCSLLRFAQQHWQDPGLECGVPTAEEHLKRIVAGYSLEISPGLSGLDGHLEEALAAMEEISRGGGPDQAVRLVERLFGSVAGAATPSNP